MDWYLDINGLSRHSESAEEFLGKTRADAIGGSWNERNYGLGVTAKEGNTLYSLGGYMNSFNEPSIYAGMGYEFPLSDKYDISLGALAGIVTGYEEPITPMVLPKLSFGLGDFGNINFMYAPEYKDKSPEVWMMNFSVPIK